MEDKPVAHPDPSGTTPLTPNISAQSSECENNTRKVAAGGKEGGVELPLPSSSTNVLARFEFEMGRGNEGSKVLMVEWDCSRGAGAEPSAEDRAGWEVSWEGKATTYAQDDNEALPPVLRVYFLLPQNAPVPPSVTISHAPTERTLTTKCMPAIFTPGLGVSQPDSGRRGVLHTIWAKKRLAQLQEEINKELQTNSEGVALEMAIQERLWLINHFGFVDPDANRSSYTGSAALVERPAPPPTPQSPRSPIGGRLGEMLKGLKLSTSPSDLANAPQGTTPRLSFQSFTPDSSYHTTTATVPGLSMPRPEPSNGVASLDAVIGNSSQPVAAAEPSFQTRDPEEELFALPMSPRSPEMKTSPFSFLK